MKPTRVRPEMKIQVPSFFNRVTLFGNNSDISQEPSSDMEDGVVDMGDVNLAESPKESGGLFSSFRSRESSFSLSSRPGSMNFGRSESPRPGSMNFGRSESPRLGNSSRPPSSRALNAISNFFTDTVASVSVCGVFLILTL